MSGKAPNPPACKPDSGNKGPTAAILRLQGREEAFEDAETHIAMIRVVLSYTPSRSFGSRYREDDLRCVAERATYAARDAYNFHSTRIVAVELVGIEEADPNA